MFVRWVGMVVLALMSTGAFADVQSELDWQHYPVRINEGETLAQALDRSSPIRSRGLVFHATTDWQVQWRFWWRRTSDGCVIERVRTEVEVQIQVPQLVAGTDAQQAEFADYLSALTQHEEGHQQLALAAGEAIDLALRQFPVADSCAALETDANALGQQLLQRFREREFDYDRRTNHGQTQGAWME
ncbi:DUF922 domain-containing protein [Saccharospirillum sp. HFRX-1]|uniref:DUF922 domain-containing Zn-dependent protease n=1 Tax=unclassified Saccharospirillum TaxID=2633430 RepID=UPI0037230B23